MDTSEQNAKPSTTLEDTPRHLRILTFILVLAVLTFVAIDIWKLLNLNTNNDTSDDKPLIVVTGVIRTSGLSKEELAKLNLANNKYQITDLTTTNQGVDGYFLIGTYLNEESLGRCAQVKGTVPTDWQGKDLYDSYRRSALNVNEINYVDYANCTPYSPKPSPDTPLQKLTFEGTIKRLNRPAPDIAYDYELELSRPFTDNETASGLPQEITSTVIMPHDNNVWTNIERNVTNKVVVEGYFMWGYAESKYFLVTNVSLALQADETQRLHELVSNLEAYIKDRDATGVMSLFTPPKTDAERSSYQSIMGTDSNLPTPRLFNNVSSNFIVTDWSIAKHETGDRSENITKKDENTYIVVVKETRKSWCNAGDCAGTYSFENTGYYVLEVVKTDDSRLLIDKYYPMNTTSEVSKYSGLYF